MFDFGTPTRASVWLKSRASFMAPSNFFFGGRCGYSSRPTITARIWPPPGACMVACADLAPATSASESTAEAVANLSPPMVAPSLPPPFDTAIQRPLLVVRQILSDRVGDLLVISSTECLNIGRYTLRL